MVWAHWLLEWAAILACLYVPSLMSLANYRIVLCQTSHPGNIGATARAMHTMGLEQLYLVRPKHFPHAQATAMAAGATALLDKAVVCDSLLEALTGCALAIGLSARKRTISHRLVNVREAALEASAFTQPVALVFGTEMSGLSNAEINLCQLLAMIPTNADYSSLNLAAAVQIMSYELRMAEFNRSLASPPLASTAAELASVECLEGFYQHLQEALLHIGYLNPQAPKKLMQRLRRVYARMRLEKDEVHLLRGIFNLTINPKVHKKSDVQSP